MPNASLNSAPRKVEEIQDTLSPRKAHGLCRQHSWQKMARSRHGLGAQVLVTSKPSFDGKACSQLVISHDSHLRLLLQLQSYENGRQGPNRNLSLLRAKCAKAQGPSSNQLARGKGGAECKVTTQNRSIDDVPGVDDWP